MGSSSQPFRIAVVGGGIGGLFAAIAINHFCSEYDLQIDVYEQARQYSEIGAGLGLGPNAAKLFYRLGLGERLNDIGGAGPDRSDEQHDIWISFRRYDDGSEIVGVPNAARGEIRRASVLRSELLDVLVKIVQERNAANLHVNKRCAGVTETDNGIRINFRDGSNAVADLVIGADGIHSAVRETYVSDKALYSGLISYRGVIDMDKISPWWKLPVSVAWCRPGAHLLVYPISRDRLLTFVGFVTVPEEQLGTLGESWTSKGRREEFLRDMADFCEDARRVIELTPDVIDKWKINDRNPLDQWVFAGGHVVLLGDAAHALVPHQGAGAGQTIEDGYILARSLQQYFKAVKSYSGNDGNVAKPPRELLKRLMTVYQDVRLPRAQRVQVTSREAGNLYEFHAPEYKGLSFEESLPVFKDKVIGRMKWIWEDDLDAAFERALESALKPE
ncbi:hypothetical protein LTR10_018803 [Elasticomyces elasticus]|uniref:FAD-binding domain-containing protein n=1 Tax=Exophiala sideris TaxID=1016849 RepID=A0ABR0J9N2_9EURO|nr:hypothetical protein LTR10_018803 [Elasticomyces elasticus]KAK5029929.1 hypothetical protein LTS07_005653 [Exophiala sideris]KAK5031631.1 hypothetical protein LTR13_007620 [Exophiala sideris]KAK5058309.1 hypothetical protein LTR69_006713 [Exophiala sideris]KAK5180238.1 hypothetical protein LTR44_007363 [Eurotiomycetes sp. CCFEE 6388]